MNTTPTQPLTNPHIVVGAGRRCVCGNYDGVAITCAEVLGSLDVLAHATYFSERSTARIKVIAAVIDPLVVDCTEPVVVEGSDNG